MNRINAFDQTFLEVNHVQNGFVYRWVVLVGFKEEAEKYCYQATIANLTNVNDKITFSGKYDQGTASCHANFGSYTQSPKTGN